MRSAVEKMKERLAQLDRENLERIRAYQGGGETNPFALQSDVAFLLHLLDRAERRAVEAELKLHEVSL